MSVTSTSDRLLELLQRARGRLQEAFKTYEQAKADVQSIERTLSLLYAEEGGHAPTVNLSVMPDLSHVSGESLMERRRQAFKEIARLNGGILIVKDAGRAMIDAGLFDTLK